MRALTVRQPWASLIVGIPGKPGPKDVENRRRWHYTHTGHLLIHAGKMVDNEALIMLQDQGRIPDWLLSHGFPIGAIVGQVKLVGITKDSPSPWAELGCNHLILDERQALQKPIPYKGCQGLFNIPNRVTGDDYMDQQELFARPILATGNI